MKIFIVVALIFAVSAAAASAEPQLKKKNKHPAGHSHSHIHIGIDKHGHIHISGHHDQIALVESEDALDFLTEDEVLQVEQHIIDVAQQHVDDKEHLPAFDQFEHINIQSPQDPSTVSIEIPSHIQPFMVSQVSQHGPIVVNQHVVASQNRMARSPWHSRIYSLSTQYHVGNDQHHHHQSASAGVMDSLCNYQCTRYDMPVCGYNGRCYREFESQCTLSNYNCKHMQGNFQTVDESLCQASTTTKCYLGDF